MGRLVGYIRTSSNIDESLRPQLVGMSVDELFTDRSAVKHLRRPQRAAALRSLQPGDRLVVQSLDRLAPDLEEVRALVAELLGRQCGVQFLDERLLFDPGLRQEAEETLRLLKLGASFVAQVARDHQREGITKVQDAPQKYTGRKPKMALADAKLMITQARAKDADIEALAKQYGVSRATVYRYIRNGIPEQELIAEEKARKTLQTAKRAARQAARKRVVASQKRAAKKVADV